MEYGQTIGIYEGAIDNAISTCVDVMDKYNILVNRLHNEAEQMMKECGDFSDITNTIISAYFETAAELLRKEKPDINVDYYVNCYDSHFYIDNEEVF